MKRDPYTAEERREISRDRKAKLRDAGRCINGPLFDGPSMRRHIVHGPVVSGGKCQRCLDVHEASADARPGGAA